VQDLSVIAILIQPQKLAMYTNSKSLATGDQLEQLKGAFKGTAKKQENVQIEQMETC